MKVSKKYQVVISEKLRREAGIKPSDKMIAISKHQVLALHSSAASQRSKGMTPGLDTKEHRDETD